MGKLQAPRNSGRKWAQLPEHERAKIMQSMNEGFPTGYEMLLERYYRNLAEEKTGAAPDQP
jgi:hypothetical protein